MSTKNTITRVTKTVRIATAKRVTANRVGRRFMVATMPQVPVELLSLGHSLSYGLSDESKRGSRHKEDRTMRYLPNVAIPTGPVGRPRGSVVASDALRQNCLWPYDSNRTIGCDQRSLNPTVNRNANGRLSWLTPKLLPTRTVRLCATASK